MRKLLNKQTLKTWLKISISMSISAVFHLVLISFMFGLLKKTDCSQHYSYLCRTPEMYRSHLNLDRVILLNVSSLSLCFYRCQTLLINLVFCCRAVNNSNYGWRALRLLARRSPHFFQPTNQQFKSLPEYLENMVIKLAKELPVSNIIL